MSKLSFNKEFKYERVYGKISGYTTAFNAVSMGYPFVECIKSMVGFCDEVVIVDGCSTDGTWQALEDLAAQEPKIQLYQNPWDLEEPGMDGAQKAFARALCTHDFLWQQDLDEVVHEADYEKVKMITKRFPPNADILHLPVIELWGDSQHVTGRRHAWKWRMSRNKPEITHGINNHARLVHPESGKVFAKDGMSDGCEYVNVMTYEHLPHTGFWNTNFEMARLHLPEDYAKGINNVFKQLPSVFHYSWASLPLKVKQFTTNWNAQWDVLYQRERTKRFADVETEEQIKSLCSKLYEEGGEESDTIRYRFPLERSNPDVMKEWIEKNV
jgi:glycosyltransferase involved in cell wall biosynthesis